MMKKTLMLVDDHLLFLEGLQYLLETYGMNVIGKARNGREAFIKAQILKPDIILMDIRMPECSGLDALKLIKARMPEIKIIMLTTSDEDEDLFDAIRLGASGYLLKNTDAKDLIRMLSDMDEVPLSPGLALRLLDEFKRNSMEKNVFLQRDIGNMKINNLTERQMEVLEMVAGGKTYKEAGEALGLTERTVKYHMGKIIDRLHLDNRAQVIAFAMQSGILDNKIWNSEES
jgi:two-component system NarL family response regulator